MPLDSAVEDNSADPVENIDLISSPILAYPIPESIFPIPKSAPIAPISAPPTSALASDQVYNNPTISSLPIPESIFPIPKSVPIAPVSAPPTSAPVSGLDFRIHDNSNCAPFGPVPRLVPLSRQENPFWLLDEIINFGATELTYTIDLFTYPVKLDE